ncbi:MAG: hypothetical protein AAF467_28110 [Actinomycetota bacterium]
MRSISVEGSASRLGCPDGDPTADVIVPAVPDLAAARRFANAVRSVSSVTITVSDHGTRCDVHGRSGRLPFVRHVPLRVGLGLAQLGVPTTITGQVA